MKGCVEFRVLVMRRLVNDRNGINKYVIVNGCSHIISGNFLTTEFSCCQPILLVVISIPVSLPLEVNGGKIGG